MAADTCQYRLPEQQPGRPDTALTILNAQQGVSGTFDNVSSNLAFLTPCLTYETNRLTLNLKRNDVLPQTLVQGENAQALADGMVLQLADSLSLPHDLSNTTPEARLQLHSQGKAVDTSGLPMQKNTVQLTTRVNLDLTPSLSLGLKYTGEIAKDSNDQSIWLFSFWRF